MAKRGMARRLWIWESECWDAEMRWIWTNWIELKNRYGKRCRVCCERKVWRSDGEVGVRWDVLVWGRVGLVGGAVKRDSGRGVCYGHGVSGRGAGKVVDVK